MGNKLIVSNIDNCRQNHPELVVRDLGLSNVRDILKYRGINKWLRVRRLLIQLKMRWLTQIKDIEDDKKQELDYGRKQFLKGYGECLKDCRQQVRALCHSPRDIDFPLNPRDFGTVCVLPENFPKRPHKRWFWGK